MTETAPQRDLAPYPSQTPTSEAQTLTEFLDYYRSVFIRKAEGLTREQLAVTVAASTLSLGGLVKHMALVEDNWFVSRFSGQAMPDMWADDNFADDPDWEIHSASEHSPSDLVAIFDDACARSLEAVGSSPDLDAVAQKSKPDGTTWNLRWILVHMIEEYARHCGHADFLRESIDGAVDD